MNCLLLQVNCSPDHFFSDLLICFSGADPCLWPLDHPEMRNVTSRLAISSALNTPLPSILAFSGSLRLGPRKGFGWTPYVHVFPKKETRTGKWSQTPPATPHPLLQSFTGLPPCAKTHGLRHGRGFHRHLPTDTFSLARITCTAVKKVRTWGVAG